ncbi:MAG TPA: polysaccharide deacetylase [Opitutaceae bacterium]|jgi:peptidoglycan/xylan/chitin deacetylase (PgdA/CDA1 family)|nr:polysaccharide deacetylase [Opitutaceae bacterium]
MTSSSARFSPPARFGWPGSHRCAAMLCFDVDGETTALAEDAGLARRRTLMSQCEYGPRIGVPRLLGLLAHLGVPATFFVPGYIAEHHPRMVEAIVAGGHEIGLHGYLHEKLAGLTEAQEEEILVRCLGLLERLAGTRPAGYRAPWFETNPWTAALLARHGLSYGASEMGDDVPYLHPGGLVEIPGQWLLEDWEQFAFSADPAWGFVPENCAKVYDLWWREFEAMHDFGCCFTLTLHPWLSGRPSRVRLLEDLVGAMRARGGVWFARGREIAAHVRAHPGARRELDYDRPAVLSP